MSEEDATVTDELALGGIKACLTALIKGLQGDGSKRFVDISDENQKHFSELSQVFPRSRFIHFITDPREIIAVKDLRDPKVIQQELLNWYSDIEEIRDKYGYSWSQEQGMP